MEHLPYLPGSDGRCDVCVIGESHKTLEDNSDRSDLTIDVMRRHMGGDTWISFFQAIQFAFARDASMWKETGFFNFFMRLEGLQFLKEQNRDSELSKEPSRRLWRIAQDHSVRKMFVFSKRAGECLTLPNNAVISREESFSARFSEWGYEAFGVGTSDSKVHIYKLRHPSRYDTDTVDSLRRAVMYAMDQ